MAIKTAEDLLIHQLSDIYSAGAARLASSSACSFNATVLTCQPSTRNLRA